MSENIVSYTSEELAEKRLRGESLTGWQQVMNATDQERGDRSRFRCRRNY